MSLPPLKKTTVLELLGWGKKAILHDVIVDSGLVGPSPWAPHVTLVESDVTDSTLNIGDFRKCVTIHFWEGMEC